jgi:hypothetical protein
MNNAWNWLILYRELCNTSFFEFFGENSEFEIANDIG